MTLGWARSRWASASRSALVRSRERSTRRPNLPGARATAAKSGPWTALYVAAEQARRAEEGASSRRPSREVGRYAGAVFGMLEGADLLILAVIVLLLFGGSQLPKLARSLGEAQRELKQGLAGSDDRPPGADAEKPSQ